MVVDKDWSQGPQKRKIVRSFTHTHVYPDLYDLLSKKNLGWPLYVLSRAVSMNVVWSFKVSKRMLKHHISIINAMSNSWTHHSFEFHLSRTDPVHKTSLSDSLTYWCRRLEYSKNLHSNHIHDTFMVLLNPFDGCKP